jgi:site-specific recombinase XerD
MSSRKTTFSLVIFLNKSRPKKNGECPILLKINIQGKKLTLQLHRSAHPNSWNHAKARTNGKTAEDRALNEYIEVILVKARQKFNELTTFNDVVTPEMLRDALMGVNTAKPNMLVALWEEHLEEMIKLIGRETTKATCQKHGAGLKHLKAFIQLKYNMKDMPVKMVDNYFIAGFATYLKTDCDCSHNTTVKFLQLLKKIINICLRNRWMQVDPYLGLNLKLKVIDRQYLNEAELKRLINYQSPVEHMNRIRDFFVFSCYTGLAYIDLKTLKRKEIECIDSLYWIKTKRQKTGVSTNVPLLEIPFKIINKYSDLNRLRDDDPVLPIPTNQRMNACLKELAVCCGINKELTFHIARHTFATTVTMTNGVPIESVSKMLGHSSIKSTQHYAKIIDKKLGDDMAALAQRLNSKLVSSLE